MAKHAMENMQKVAADSLDRMLKEIAPFLPEEKPMKTDSNRRWSLADNNQKDRDTEDASRLVHCEAI